MRRRLGLAITAVLTCAIASPSPASAAALEYNLAVAGDASGSCIPFLAGYGQACITQFDNIWILDQRADSSSVAVHWRFVNGERRGLCRWTGGNGTDGHCNKDFNDHQIEWRIGRCDSDFGDCTNLSGYKNWTVWNDTQPG